MKLYVYDHCPFCVRARMAFALKNVPVEVAIIMEGDVETPTRMIGKKMVPILQKEDGSYMAESLDIVRYADQQGTPQFAGSVDAQIDTWLKNIWSEAAKLFVPRFTQANFAELATKEARDAFFQREQKAFGNLADLIASTPTLINEITPKLDALVPLVQHRQQADINDIVLWPVLRSLSIVKDLPFPPAVQDYMQRLEKETAIPLLFNQAM